jgi:HPt (histidine-containing phosphotransfer) domain-containing protein
MFTGIDESTRAAEGKSFQLSEAAADLGDTRDAVDMSVLKGLEEAQVEGEPDIVVELMELYLEDAARKLAAMRECSAGKDGRSLARLAHSLKGSSANLGACRAAALCDGLERIAEGEPGGGGVLLAGLELELACVRRVFEAERRRRA